ncbi:MAG: hypothetical protein H7Z18_01335 [Methylophilaceae bacterium]|nr:hypothetical protein [Methylophilaceae bacterium]
MKIKITAAEKTCAGLTEHCSTLDALLLELFSAVKSTQFTEIETASDNQTPTSASVNLKHAAILDMANLDECGFKKTIMLNTSSE